MLARTIGGGNIATGARNDAGGDGVLVFTEGVADGNDLLANLDGLGIAESSGGEAGNVFDFKKSDVV